MAIQIQDRVDEIYSKIKSKALQKQVAGTTTILILVHPDLDSICAVRILVDLFKSDCIAYEIFPISSYADLKDANDKITSRVKSIVMINVGGMVELEEFLTIGEDCVVYVFDSHRPLNLHNLFASSKVLIVDDGQIENLRELKFAFEELEFGDGSDDGSDDGSEDGSDGEDDQDRDRDEDTERTETGETQGQDQSDNESLKRKRTLSKELVKTKKEKTLKREYQRLIQEYYSEGSYFGLAVVNTMYSLATQVGKVNNQYLWYTIVGMTSNYTYGKMNIIQYTQFASEYKEEVERLAIRTTIEDSQSILGSESRESHADDDSIKFIEDLQLVLLKHWNLYDSMFHSNYVATKLGVWKEKGRQAITNLLVQMGFPQKESKQFYREMSVDFKKDLKQTLMDLAPRYKMPNIVLPSFEKKYGYLVTLSASDVVYSLTALLDCGSTWLQKRGISGYEDVLDHSDASKMLNSREKEQFQERSHAREGGLVGAGVGTRSVPGGIATHILEYMSKLEIDERSDWVKHFYLAYDALEKYFLLTSPRIIQHGILLAIHYQRILVQTAISILDKRLVQTLGQFQLAILKPTNVDHMDGEDESKIFGTSIPMLHRLCVFLMDAFNEYKKKRLPFVMVALNTETDLYLVMGRSLHNQSKNPFGLAFLEAADRTGVDIKHDFFDSSCIQVQKDDLSNFLENLQWVVRAKVARVTLGDVFTMKGFKVPPSLLQASQARVAKIKQQVQEDVEKKIEAVDVPTMETNFPKSEPVPIPSQPQEQSRSRSNSTSNTVIEIEQIRIQREERRQKFAELRKQREEMSDFEQQTLYYRTTIDQFRLKFVQERAKLKIKTSRNNVLFVQPKIKVLVRKRPLSELESSKQNFDIVTTQTERYPYAHLYLHEPKVKLDRSHEVFTHRFEFDCVFDETATNELVYKDAAESLVKAFLEGGRSTLFAYGQTGSGKTHTIFGTKQETGLYEYVCRYIMNNIGDKILTLCFVEIYGNRVYDLFQQRNRVSLLEDKNGNSQLVGQEEVTVTSLEQMMELIRLGMECRTTGTTEANQHSSRSHAIVQMTIRDAQGSVESKFSLVDLAGSERGVDTGNISKSARQEGSDINKSLLALKECIRALYLQRTHKDYSMHIPFRASKLTQILRDSFLGKNSQTSMIAMISPGSLSAEHSLNTLRYADRVKEFKNETKLTSLKSPTEQQVMEPELDIVQPIVEQFDDLEFSKSLGSFDAMSMGSSFSIADHREVVPSSLSQSFTADYFEPKSDTKLVLSLSEKKSNQSLQSTTTPISQIGFVLPLQQDLDPQELFDSVIQQHLESIAKMGGLTRKERVLLSNPALESEKTEYCDTMLQILNQRIEIWTSLKSEIQKLRNLK